MAEIPLLEHFRIDLIAGKHQEQWSLLSSFCSPDGPALLEHRKSSPVPPTVRGGAILMKDWPGVNLLGLECESYSGQWTLLKTLDVCALDRKIHAAGWNFFFMATEVKVIFLGSIGAAKVHNALKRILGKVKQPHFNGLEVTAIITRHFLGVPYVTVSAHSRHMQQSCCLDTAEVRKTSQEKSEWARG